jgi:hypothetical protein
MSTFIGRLDRLEQSYRAANGQPPLRLLVSTRWKGPVNWAASKCSRVRNPDGRLFETITLEGDDASVTPEQLERFIGRSAYQTSKST